MDRGLDGQIVPDIIYGYICKRPNIRARSPRHFITVEEYGAYQTRKQRRKDWKPIKKISTLADIEEAMSSCLGRWSLGVAVKREILRNLFILSEWKLTQMPLYKHVCPKCQHEETDLFRYDDPLPKCPKCDTEMVRLIGKSTFNFKQP